MSGAIVVRKVKKIMMYLHDEAYLGHSSDWETNKKRCPQYLIDFQDVDEDWPEGIGDFDEEQDGIIPVDENTGGSVVLYHREKTLFLLQKKILTVDKKEMDKLLKHFPGILNNFTIEEILNFKLREVLRGRIKGS